MAQAARNLELWDCCSLGCRSLGHFTVAGGSFARCPRITFSLRRYIECVVRWSRAGIARDGTLRSRFLLLLPASGPFVGSKARRNTTPCHIHGFSPVCGSLSAAERSAIESLRRTRDDLRKTVQELQSTNEALQAESLERKHAEEARREAQAELARVSRVTTMGELTASLAHEVNQPIAAAVTNANTCLRWLTRDHPDLKEAREAASRIVADATRAAGIISRVRLLFKKSIPQQELVDVNEAIREMIVLLRSEATRYNITVRMELAADLPRIMGDRVQLQQVLMNLIVNSIDAMKEVDGTRELAVKSRRTEKEVLVSVSDTGVGLPPQQAEEIFNAFFTTKPHGTGMGLRISRSI